eukprot:scaffold289264_cov19-Tisochrysis_lutea.AAC.1
MTATRKDHRRRKRPQAQAQAQGLSQAQEQTTGTSTGRDQGMHLKGQASICRESMSTPACA